MASKGFSKKVLERFAVLEKAYGEEGSMTVRRCFYILVGKNLIKNSTGSYQLLSQHLVKARELGVVDWNLITDRHRTFLKRYTSNCFEDAFEEVCKDYRKNSMLLQDNYVEVWVEKDAVSGVIYEFTYGLDVPLFVGKGFSSVTYLKKASDRFASQDKPCTILYVSDFDPEGEFFPKKVVEKLEKYGSDNFTVKKIALTKKQIKENKLPSNLDFTIKPKHLLKKYVQDFVNDNGEIQIELDALSNKVLLSIIEKELKKLIDFNIPVESDRESSREVAKWREDNLK